MEVDMVLILLVIGHYFHVYDNRNHAHKQNLLQMASHHSIMRRPKIILLILNMDTIV